MARSRKRRDSRRSWRGSLLLLAFLAGAVAVLLLLRDGAPEPDPTTERLLAAQRRAELEGALTRLLAAQARWDEAGSGRPLTWQGELAGRESLVRWNSRVSGEIEALGLEVLSGTEQLIERRGRFPLQRLRLTVGVGEETLATVVVETTRSPSLPPVF